MPEDLSGKLLTSDGLIDAPDRVLVVVAHPDDIDFGFAGTVAQLTAAGSHVAYCLVTSGEAGEDDMTVSTEELAALREREQTAAAAEVGVTSLHWLHHPDGAVQANLQLRIDISRIIRIEKPDVVISMSPERDFGSVYASHPDHLETAEATLRAVYPDARNPRAFTPELLDQGFEPHAVDDVWIRHGEPNLVVDITDVFDRKLAALRSHVSQVAKRDEEFDLEKVLGAWSGELAAKAGMDEGRLAEGFRILNTA